MAIPFIDLCSGIGGFHSGLVNTGHYRCVGHAEIDKNAEKAYNAIYGEEGGLNYGDLRTINPRDSPTSTCFAADFLAKASRLRDGVSVSEIQEELSSLKLPESLQKNGLRFYSWKMSSVCYRMTAAGRLIPSSPRLLKWGIISNGWCLTANTSESPNSEDGCILSDILIRDVPEKYFLSAAAMRKILSNLFRDRRVKESTKQTE